MIIENTCEVSNDEGNDDLGIYQHCHHSLKHEETDKKYKYIIYIGAAKSVAWKWAHNLLVFSQTFPRLKPIESASK